MLHNTFEVKSSIIRMFFFFLQIESSCLSCIPKKFVSFGGLYIIDNARFCVNGTLAQPKLPQVYLDLQESNFGSKQYLNFRHSIAHSLPVCLFDRIYTLESYVHPKFRS